MKAVKEGGHRLFEEDMETSQYVSNLLQDLRKNGMDAVRKYSREFDQWDPPCFELSEQQIDEAISQCDDYAPEHLELHVRDTDYYCDRLQNYGSLFVGEETTVAYGDKSIGTNHILPTGRSARYTGGVWVGKFLKTVTYQKMTREASVEVAKVTARQCKVERMLAHGITATLRVQRYAKG